MPYFSEAKQRAAAVRLCEHLGAHLDGHFSVRLWDGSILPMGPNASQQHVVVINDPGVIGTLLRKPSAETALLHFARGALDIEGDLIDFILTARERRTSKALKKVRKTYLLRQLLPFLTAKTGQLARSPGFEGDATGQARETADNKDFIQFHYDLSNEFYGLFLGEEMVYSCGYFRDATNSIDQAQHDKLEMICRKLRLQPGERFLDIGCGWGALVCHAARHHGVQAHGVTLSEAQLAFAKEKVKRLGLMDRVHLELRDYTTLEGSWDKIASIGMFEHIGLAHMETYFRHINSLLSERGLLLNHGICRRAKGHKRRRGKVRPEKKLILKYIFPGGELDHVGHTVDMMEVCGFEVHDVESWREHYALTTQRWYRALMERKAEALRHVSPEKFRLWALYLAGVSIGFTQGSLGICQVLGSKRQKGPSPVPLTRDDLYR
ncbi:MAG: class I SAM-dependent methyltransferase [Opitutales bacterium]